MPKRNFIVIWFAETASHRCPGLQVGCTGFTSKGEVKQSPQRRHVRTSKQSLKLYRPPTFFRASSLLKMCTQASRILKCICWRLRGSEHRPTGHRGRRFRRRRRRSTPRRYAEHRGQPQRQSPYRRCGCAVSRSLGFGRFRETLAEGVEVSHLHKQICLICLLAGRQLRRKRIVKSDSPESNTGSHRIKRGVPW